eukprot:3625644-Amphidinium_carterae.1
MTGGWCDAPFRPKLNPTLTEFSVQLTAITQDSHLERLLWDTTLKNIEKSVGECDDDVVNDDGAASSGIEDMVD